MLLFVNGVVSPTAPPPPVTTLLQSYPGAYTTFRTHNSGLELVFYERHLQRLANSAKILFESCPKLLFQPEISSTSTSLQQMKSIEWESMILSFVNDSMTKAIPYALKERKGETELAFTALITGKLENLIPDKRVDEEDINRVFNMHLHVSLYDPIVFGVRTNGAHLAVVGRARDIANAKYSDWVRIRKPLEKLRPPSATELLLSNDGDQILEGCLTNFFVLSRKDDVEEDSEYAENEFRKNKYGYSLELQTAPISDGVLPGVVREVGMFEIKSSVRELLHRGPASLTREEAFITNSLRLLQHVETIRVPSSWNSLSSKTWKEVTWEEKQFEEGPGSITAIIQKEVLKMAKLEGHSVKSFLK
ncbi:putative aminotransferase class IV [Helianthus annuus]|nr:putative aminotransferase class IV [Helianthus annuus]